VEGRCAWVREADRARREQGAHKAQAPCVERVTWLDVGHTTSADDMYERFHGVDETVEGRHPWH
jgi:hypothetical protein